MKIKFLISCYTPSYPFFNKNDVVDLPESLAKKMIEQGVAVKFDEENSFEAKLETLKKIIDYSELTVAELKTELEIRQLSTKGKKSDLIKRLKEDDLK